MSQSVPSVSPPPGEDDSLLRTLLVSEVPSRHEQIRPARLRATPQQRTEALRGFRRRTWVDRALTLAERALVLAAVTTFAYWLFEGYGRDWLHELRQAHAAQVLAPALTPSISLPMPRPPPPPVAPPQAVALPFTRPEDALPETAPATREPGDSFMVPQTLHTAPDAADPRPRYLRLPTLGADMSVYEVFQRDGGWEVAEYAAGFHNGTALPGTVGNSVFSGHAGLRGAVFKDLGRLKPGDDVIVETGGWRYVYRVRGSLSVWPNQIEVMDQTPTPVLTLITCTNWDTQRLVVVADLVDARPLS